MTYDEALCIRTPVIVWLRTTSYACARTSAISACPCSYTAERLSAGNPRRRDVLHRRSTHLLHRHPELRAQDFQHAFHAFLAKGRQTPNIRPADTYARRARRQRLVNIGPVTDAAIQEHGDASLHGLDHFGQAIDSRPQRFRRATAMVRDHDSVHTVFDGEFGILAAIEAFQHDFHSGQLLEAV